MDNTSETIGANDSDALSPNELECVKQFLQIVNSNIRGHTQSRNVMCQRTAVKFLMARKFDVTRAIQLYKCHEITRLQEGLNDIDPTREDLQRELKTGKFTILNVRDPNGAAIAIFTARLHSAKHRNSFLREANHQITLQALVYQLDMALDCSLQTQRSGIVFIYDMSGSDRSNFEYSFCQKLLNLLKGAYPAKLKRVFIVAPPMWFKAPYQILRLLYPQKLRDRVNLVDIRQLSNYLPPDSLPLELGGTYVHNHQAWLAQCRRASMDRLRDLCDKQSAHALLSSRSPSLFATSEDQIESQIQDQDSSDNLQTGTYDNLHTTSTIDSSDEQNNSLMPQSLSNHHDEHDKYKFNRWGDNEKPKYDYCEDSGLTLREFIQRLKLIGKSGLVDEYKQIRMRDAYEPFLYSRMPMNTEKNRYIDILCFDHTRVILEPDDSSNSPTMVGSGKNSNGDYINANYIDGYRQPKEFISTQGPMPNTFIDFWRMIWQTNCRVIVMVTRTFERDMSKCDQYWPTSTSRTLDLKRYVVTLENYSTFGQYNISQLKLTDNKLRQTRQIWHFQFVSWPDYGVPLSACSLLEFHEQVTQKQQEAIDQIKMSGIPEKFPPIVVHCSAGVGRSPTFITLDICIKRLNDEGVIEVRKVVEKLRQQRALSIQTVEQYIFCHTALLEYALGRGLLQDTDWNGFDFG